jgi:peptidyl-prolyl cis-trans isomerase A (cyclophilin A)
MTPAKNTPQNYWSACLLSVCLLPNSVLADTIVSVQTNLGNFTLELFEDKAPATVAHFLTHLEAGNYQFSMVHEATNTTITGGLYFYDSCSEGPVPVASVVPIPVENTGLENSTGSLAMVPLASDSSMVGGQWHINLGHNQNAFPPGQEPVVIGEVVEGIETANTIADAWRVPMNVSLSVPTVNYDGFQQVQCGLFTRDNVVKVAMDAVSVDPPGTSDAANVFDESSSMLNIKVDAGAEGLLAVSLMLQSTDPVIIQAQPETVSVLTDAVDGIATFDGATGNLNIPELVIDGQVAYTDVLFRLTDAENLFFTLLSANTP